MLNLNPQSDFTDFSNFVSALQSSQNSDQAKLRMCLRALAVWRSTLIQNAVLNRCGCVVQAGPFKGMRFTEKSSEGCHIPKLLGVYEQELHAHIEAAIARAYRHVVNIGASDGYYAIGLAMRMPGAEVHAFDLDKKAHSIVRRVAEENGAGDRVRVDGLFRGEDFASYPAGGTLVVCDIEGAEADLLDPEKHPDVLGHDMIVETHEGVVPGVGQLLCSRFAATHDIRLVPHGGRDLPTPDFFGRLDHLDQLLAVWEWRSGATPWAVMTRK